MHSTLNIASIKYSTWQDTQDRPCSAWKSKSCTSSGALNMLNERIRKFSSISGSGVRIHNQIVAAPVFSCSWCSKHVADLQSMYKEGQWCSMMLVKVSIRQHKWGCISGTMITPSPDNTKEKCHFSLITLIAIQNYGM